MSISPYLLLPARSIDQARREWHASNAEIRRHQIRTQVELEQRADFYSRLSITATDPEARDEALRMSNEFAIRANRIRTAVALTNWSIPESADEECRRLEREANAF